MSRPTPEQVKEARGKARMYLAGLRHNPEAAPLQDEQEALRTLLAATEPPTNEEICAEYGAALAQMGWERKAGELTLSRSIVRRFLGAPEGK